MVGMLKVAFEGLLQEAKRERPCCNIRTLGELCQLSKSILEALNTVPATKAKKGQAFHKRLPKRKRATRLSVCPDLYLLQLIWTAVKESCF